MQNCVRSAYFIPSDSYTFIPTMSDSMELQTIYELAKANAWHKNELAHQKMRERQKWQHPFCAHCAHHRCADPTIVPGKKALKKSKFHSERKFAFYYMRDL